MTIEEPSVEAREFSERLVECMKERGFSSRAASSGVRIRPLCEILQCSKTSAYKYVSGSSVPDYTSVVQISGWLEVNPSWLLFGAGPKRNDLNSPAINYDDFYDLISAITPLLKKEDDSRELLLKILKDAKSTSENRQSILDRMRIASESASLFFSEPSV